MPLLQALQLGDGSCLNLCPEWRLFGFPYSLDLNNLGGAANDNESDEDVNFSVKQLDRFEPVMGSIRRYSVWQAVALLMM